MKTLHIQSRGLLLDSKTIKKTIERTISAVEVADINVDNSPEAYAFITSARKSPYEFPHRRFRKLKKSLTQIYPTPC